MRLPAALFRILHQGNKLHCPICNSNFNRFRDFGTPKRNSVQCPQCFSLERHRLLWLFMEEKGLFATQGRILHVAPEAFFFNFYTNNKGVEYVPVDKFEPGNTYPEGTQNADITELSFPDNSFDAILCNHVLEHIPDDRKAMRELYRVLKPGGWAILQVPGDFTVDKTYEDWSITSLQERLKHFGQIDHVRLYGKDYADRLKEAGFIVEMQDYLGTLSQETRERLRLLEDELTVFCRKA